MLYNQTLGYTIVNSEAEEIALAPHWSRIFTGGPLKEVEAPKKLPPEPEPEDEPEPEPEEPPEREPSVKARRGRPAKGPAAA